MDPVVAILVYFILGATAGLLGGMLGVGGGVVVCPALIFIFEWLGVFDDPMLPSNSIVLFAVGTSMASVIFTTSSSAIAHYRRRNIDWSLVKLWIPCLVLGAITASLVAEYLPVQYLRTIVASVILLVATVLLLNRLPTAKKIPPKRWIPYSITSCGGLICGLVGQGGGNVVVPSLLAYKNPVSRATATASFGAACVSTFATAGYIFTGFELNVQNALGYVYLPALIPIVLMSVLFAPVGVRIGQKLSKQVFVRIFGLLMIVVSLRLFYSILFG